MSDAMVRGVWCGVLLNRRTIAMCELVQHDLGCTLVYYQGSYNAGGVSASAGTHNGGGAVDVFPPAGGPTVAATVLAMRRRGFAAWHRPAIPGLWGEHIHAIAIGDPELSPAAAAQVGDYYHGRDGLADHGPDTGPKVRPVHVFDYAQETPDMITDSDVERIAHAVTKTLLAADLYPHQPGHDVTVRTGLGEAQAAAKPRAAKPRAARKRAAAKTAK